MAEYDWRDRDQAAKRNGKPAVKTASSRFAALNYFVDRHQQRFTRKLAGMVWLHLYRHADRQNRIKISHGRIAESLGASRRRVISAIGELEKCGAIKCIRRGKIGNQDPNKYQLMRGDS